MFGYNIKDKDGKQLYKELSFEKFETLVNEMVAYAKSQPPLNPHEAIAEANKNTSLQTEKIGPIVRVRGLDVLKTIEQYTHFVRIGIHALQVVYYEMELEEPVGEKLQACGQTHKSQGNVQVFGQTHRLRHGQVTLVDTYGIPLEEKLIIGIFCMFFGEGGKVEFLKTPPHVAVGVEVFEMD